VKIFEYVVGLKPTEKDRKAGERPQVIVQPTCVYAKDENEVRIIAAQAIPKEHAEATDRLEVAVRPFR